MLDFKCNNQPTNITLLQDVKGFIPDLWGGLYKFLSELASARSAQRLFFHTKNPIFFFSYISKFLFDALYIVAILSKLTICCSCFINFKGGGAP